MEIKFQARDGEKGTFFEGNRATYWMRKRREYVGVTYNIRMRAGLSGTWGHLGNFRYLRDVVDAVAAHEGAQAS